ncbi:MAG: proline--tRNA ligase, partial [Planctomycetota bacterium]
LIVKTLVFLSEQGPVAAVLRGDHEVSLVKLARAAGVERLELATPGKIEEVTGGPLGFSGPVGLDVRMICDTAVTAQANFVTGGNRKDLHLRNVNCNRDFKPEAVADIRYALRGDACPKCGSPLEFLTGIEVGHVFKLGTKYSEAMGALYQDDEGKKLPAVMGCYGIGVNRILAAAVENHHDDAGILWPREIAPYHVHVVTVNPGDAKIAAASNSVVEKLEKSGWEVLWDDRDQPAGVKFTDADLVGLPVRVTVGSRTVKNGTVDLKLRTEKEQEAVALKEVARAVKDAWARYPH